MQGHHPPSDPHHHPQSSQNCAVHTPPGGVHTPQLSLQHSSPARHVTFPHDFPPGPSGGKQSSFVHPSPGRVQTPQLALQHSSPAGHAAAPQTVPLPAAGGCSGGRQNSSVQAPPGATQVPHDELQQARPAAQTVAPHASPLGGRGVGVAAGVVVVVVALDARMWTRTGFARAPSAIVVMSTRDLTERETDGTIFVSWVGWA